MARIQQIVKFTNCLAFSPKKIMQKIRFIFNLHNFNRHRDFVASEHLSCQIYNSKTVRFSAKCCKYFRSKKSGSTIIVFTKNYVTIHALILNVLQRRTNFFLKRRNFPKTATILKPFTNGFLAKNCIRISRHPKTKVFSSNTNLYSGCVIRYNRKFCRKLP